MSTTFALKQKFNSCKNNNKLMLITFLKRNTAFSKTNKT